jgi:hypothetical protein
MGKSRKIAGIAYAALFVLCLVMFFVSRGQVIRREGAMRIGPSAGVTDTEVVLYESIRISPGIYRAQLAYETDSFVRALCTVKDPEPLFRGVQSTGEALAYAEDGTDFEFYVRYPTRNLWVVILTDGETEIGTGDLIIRNTGKLWTVLLVIITFVFLTFLAISRFLELNNAAKQSGARTGFCLAVLILLTSLPYLFTDFFWGSDTIYHLQRIEGLMQGLLAGQFPVRLEPHWLQGYGYANAVFYCPLFLLPSALLRMAGFTVSFCWNFYGILSSVAVVLVSYYSFRRIFGTSRTALFSTALYALSVIHFYKMAEASALGEGTAMIFLPLILCGFYGALMEEIGSREQRFSFLPLGIGFAGILQSHVLTTEITVAVSVLLVCSLLPRLFEAGGKRFLSLLGGAGLALGLSLWFVVPFLDYYLTQNWHIRNVFGRKIQERGLQAAQLYTNFWTGDGEVFGGGMYHAFPAGLGLVIPLGMLLYLGRQILRKNDRDARNAFALRCLILGLLLSVMTLSIFPWDRIQSLGGPLQAMVSSLQFPNRLLGWATLLGTFVCGSLMESFAQRGEKWAVRVLLLAAVLGIAGSSLYLNDYFTVIFEGTSLSNAEGMGTGDISGGEYLIEGTDATLLTQSAAVAGPGTEILEDTRGALRAQLVCRNTSAQESFLEVQLLYYCGYRAEDGDGRELAVSAGTNGVIRVALPAGFDGTVRIRFTEPASWRVSEVLSLLTLVGILVWYRRKKGALPEEVQSGEADLPGRKAEDAPDMSLSREFYAGGNARSLRIGALFFLLFISFKPFMTNYFSGGIYLGETLALLGLNGHPGFYKLLILLLLIAFAILLSAVFRTGSAEAVGASEGAAFLVTVTFFFAPYTIHTLYTRMALGEYLAMAFLLLALGAALTLRTVPAGKARTFRTVLLAAGAAGFVLTLLIRRISYAADAEYYRLGAGLFQSLRLFPGKGYSAVTLQPFQVGFVSVAITLLSLFLAGRSLFEAREEKAEPRPGAKAADGAGVVLLVSTLLMWAFLAIGSNLFPAGDLRVFLAGRFSTCAMATVAASLQAGAFALWSREKLKDQRLWKMLMCVLFLLALCSAVYQIDACGWQGQVVYADNWF